MRLDREDAFSLNLWLSHTLSRYVSVTPQSFADAAITGSEFIPRSGRESLWEGINVARDEPFSLNCCDSHIVSSSESNCRRMSSGVSGSCMWLYKGLLIMSHSSAAKMLLTSTRLFQITLFFVGNWCNMMKFWGSISLPGRPSPSSLMLFWIGTGILTVKPLIACIFSLFFLNPSVVPNFKYVAKWDACLIKSLSNWLRSEMTLGTVPVSI